MQGGGRGGGHRPGDQGWPQGLRAPATLSPPAEDCTPSGSETLNSVKLANLRVTQKIGGRQACWAEGSIDTGAELQSCVHVGWRPRTGALSPLRPGEQLAALGAGLSHVPAVGLPANLDVTGPGTSFIPHAGSLQLPRCSLAPPFPAPLHLDPRGPSVHGCSRQAGLRLGSKLCPWPLTCGGARRVRLEGLRPPGGRHASTQAPGREGGGHWTEARSAESVRGPGWETTRRLRARSSGSS